MATSMCILATTGACIRCFVAGRRLRLCVLRVAQGDEHTYDKYDGEKGEFILAVE